MKTAIEPEKAVLFDIAILRQDMNGTLDSLFARLQAAVPPRCLLVSTLNVDFVVNAIPVFFHRGNPDLWRVLRNADLVTADGMPLVVLSRLLGCRLPERVTGADMIYRLCERAERENRSLYFLGGTGDSAIRAAEILRRRFPKLEIKGVDPAFVSLADDAAGRETNAAVCRRINAAGADILLVGFGNPKQELWLWRYRKELQVGAAIGIGGTFNFVTGGVKRAPEWMRRSGLEWIYRIIQEPRRLWKRYGFGLIKFGALSAQIMAAEAVVCLIPKEGEISFRDEGNDIILDLGNVARLSNRLRLIVHDLRCRADLRGGTLKFIKANPLVRWQLVAHKLQH